MAKNSFVAEVTFNDEANEVREELFKSLLNRYHNNLEKLMKGTDFVFNYVHLLHCKMS